MDTVQNENLVELFLNTQLQPVLSPLFVLSSFFACGQSSELEILSRSFKKTRRSEIITTRWSLALCGRSPSTIFEGREDFTEGYARYLLTFRLRGAREGRINFNEA